MHSYTCTTVKHCWLKVLWDPKHFGTLDKLQTRILAYSVALCNFLFEVHLHVQHVWEKVYVPLKK